MNKEVTIRPEVAAGTAAAVEVAPSRGRRWGLRLLFWSVPLLLAAVGLYYWLGSGRYVSTDNAYVQQNKLSVTAQVAGPIVEVAVKENQEVKAGDLLFRIDPTPYRIALAQADAAIAQASAETAVRVDQLEADYRTAVPDIAGAEAQLTLASHGFERQNELLRRGFTTRVRYDEAVAALAGARQKLAEARVEAQSAQTSIRTVERAAQPTLAAARAAREKVAFDLARTEVRAPIGGRVAQADRLLPGQGVVSGLPVVAIVDTRASWIEANFKETDLAKVRVGQPAEVTLDAYPGVKLRGHVASIGAGTGSEFAVLPAQNASGNWVKVTQRVPVRIVLDTSSPRQLIAGTSAEVTVDTEPKGR